MWSTGDKGLRGNQSDRFHAFSQSPVEAISNFAQEVVCKAQPMTIVVHKVEGQERKYSDNNTNGTHPSVCGPKYFATSNLV